MEPLISWDAPEHIHTEKNNDWYWAVGIITITATVLAFIFENIIFGIFIIVASFALVTHAAKKPRTIHYEINDRGIVVDNILFPFLSLDSFWIDAHEEPPKILIKSHKTFMPYIAIYIEGVDREKVRDTLLNYIAETEHREPLTQKLLEKFGF
jgi:flagellar motor component MotA